MDAKELDNELKQVVKRLHELLEFSEKNTDIIHDMESEHIAEAIWHLDRIYIRGLYKD